MKLKIYSYSGCGTCRKALRFLAAAGVEHEIVPIRDQPPSKAALKRALAEAGGNLRRLFNTSGQDYRRLGLKDRLPTLKPAEAIDLLAANGNLIKRPFVLVGKEAWTGFDEADWRARLGLGQG